MYCINITSLLFISARAIEFDFQNVGISEFSGSEVLFVRAWKFIIPGTLGLGSYETFKHCNFEILQSQNFQTKIFIS